MDYNTKQLLLLNGSNSSHEQGIGSYSYVDGFLVDFFVVNLIYYNGSYVLLTNVHSTQMLCCKRDSDVGKKLNPVILAIPV